VSTPWTAYYETLPDGRRRIARENLMALEAAHPNRSLFAEIEGKRAQVIFLDRPYRIAEKQVVYNAYYLRRIPLVALPGWFPARAPLGEGHRLPSLRECTLKTARFKPGSGSGQESLEITLEYHGETVKAWLKNCPAPLLRCAEATLNQDGARGKRLSSLQEMRLIGTD
jgi:hypothetical protein